MKGKLIIIESGSDASGKETQSKKLYERLIKEGFKVRKVEYPNYDSDSSALVKMYLKGDFGKNPSDVNPYIASTFYAVDRYASFKTEWEEFYLNGGIIIADRYTTSNMVHQASKLQGIEKDNFLDWLWNLEYELYKLPIPDCVIFLDVPTEYSRQLMKDRANKFTGTQKKDIHENNIQHLTDAYNNSLYIVEKYNWVKVDCVKRNKLSSIEEIHEDIYKITKDILK
ncbi:thymidylate kinase [Clostridium estertheticum]|uniref:dTMP kinase n=1 Tax=Clostridium estertheticum TaxID=238834 RepID=UPI001C0DC5F2|nr:thymidylate kinase [Clostridium estertheticum]MBU3201575.1 thymidylate kinase [Clostridium estertheticum]WAG66273.1 thymidylate kinase [Clostridium estertheticum]